MLILDHFGYVVKDMDQAVDQFISSYNYTLVSLPIYDPMQHVNLALLQSGGQYLELVHPVDETSPSYDFMIRGGGLHHICYKVEHILESIKQLKSSGHLLFKAPVEAKLFNGKKVAFLFEKKNKQIIELVEA